MRLVVSILLLCVALPLLADRRGQLMAQRAKGGPSVWWKMNETSGDRSDGVDGSPLSGSPAASTAGKISNAIVVVNTALLTASSTALAFPTNSGFTFVGWFQKPSAANPQSDIIFNYQVHGVLFTFQFTPNGAFPTSDFFKLFSDGGGLVDFVEYPGTLGQWVFFAAWLDPDTALLNFQVNNGTIHTAVGTTALGVLTSTGSIQIQSGSASAFWLDEYGYYQHALPASERTGLYNGGAGVTFP